MVARSSCSNGATKDDVDKNVAPNDDVEILIQSIDKMRVEKESETTPQESDATTNPVKKIEAKTVAMKEEQENSENIECINGADSEDVTKPSNSKKTKSKGKKRVGKKAPSKQLAASTNSEPTSPAPPSQVLTVSKGKKSGTVPEKGQEPDKVPTETREEMYDRLKNGTKYDTSRVRAQLVGLIQNPVVMDRTITFDDNEIEQLLEEVSEIKNLLFCRLLLGHAALLPAALRANTVGRVPRG